MPLTQTIRLALRAIGANKVRSLLTMLGIIIGVASVIAVFAVGTGASQLVTKQIESLGSNLLTVSPASATVGGVNLGQGSISTLTMADVSAIAQQDPDVAAVAPLVSKNAQVVFGPNNYNTSIQGTTANYPLVKPTPVSSGRFFLAQEVNQNAHVADLGSLVAQTLFAGTHTNPIGQTIDINQIPFTVIGVLTSQGSNGFNNLDDRILIPITTQMNDLTGSQYVNNIDISAKSQAAINLAQNEVTATLRSQHQLAPGAPNDFNVFNQATVISSFQAVTAIQTELLASVAAISLLVGGIGIMNIMLVSVTERTREIGIRKAIGAPRGAILGQFLTEAVTVSVIGGLIGIALGALGAMIFAMIAHTGNILSLPPVLLSFVFSIMVGIVFGVYPARKAAGLNPIDALRYE